MVKLNDVIEKITTKDLIVCLIKLGKSSISPYWERHLSSQSYLHRSLGISIHPVPNIDTAEIAKITETAHRYLQIAFAEDLYLYCQANNINF
jgi:UDP-N-acetyl-D-mannosaminuronate dehydrogenase